MLLAAGAIAFMIWVAKEAIYAIRNPKPVARITTIEGKRHYSGPPGGYRDKYNPTLGLWEKRNTSSGHFEAIRKSGDPFKGVKREN